MIFMSSMLSKGFTKLVKATSSASCHIALVFAHIKALRRGALSDLNCARPH